MQLPKVLINQADIKSAERYCTSRQNSGRSLFKCLSRANKPTRTTWCSSIRTRQRASIRKFIRYSSNAASKASHFMCSSITTSQVPHPALHNLGPKKVHSHDSRQIQGTIQDLRLSKRAISSASRTIALHWRVVTQVLATLNSRPNSVLALTRSASFLIPNYDRSCVHQISGNLIV